MAPTRAPARDTSKAVVATTLSNSDLMALLQGSGMVSTQRIGVNRMTLENGMLSAGDDTFVYNPSKPEIPAVVVRIVSPPEPYFAFFLSADEANGGFDAGRIGREDLNGQFSKKYENAQAQAEDTTPANDVYDQIKAVAGKNGSYKADIRVQIVPPDGQLTGEEPIWTLSLSTTSVFEWRGTSQEPERGLVSDTNFMVDLGNLAISQAAEAGADETGQKVAVLKALTALREGGVVAEVRILKAQNAEKTRSWSIVNFRPIHIEDMSSAPALPEGDTGNGLPF